MLAGCRFILGASGFRIPGFRIPNSVWGMGVRGMARHEPVGHAVSDGPNLAAGTGACNGVGHGMP